MKEELAKSKKRANNFIKKAVDRAADNKDIRHRVADIHRTNLLMLEALLPSLDDVSKKRALKTIENLREQMKKASSFAL